MKHLLALALLLSIAPDSAAATTWGLAAGTTTKTSAGIDLATYNPQGSLYFECTLGTITATGTGVFKIQYSDDNSLWTDVTGGTISWADTMSDQKLAIEVIRPTHRYYRTSIARATANSVITRVSAILVGLRKLPQTQLTTAGNFAATPVVVVG